MTASLVFIGAVMGAALRYLIDRAVQRSYRGRFPWGTVAVNVLGSALLGGLVGAEDMVPPATMAFVGVGLCGALTTYSTFSYETFRLVEDGAYSHAVRNVVVSVVGTCGVVLVAYTATSAVLVWRRAFRDVLLVLDALAGAAARALLGRTSRFPRILRSHR